MNHKQRIEHINDVTDWIINHYTVTQLNSLLTYYNKDKKHNKKDKEIYEELERTVVNVYGLQTRTGRDWIKHSLLRIVNSDNYPIFLLPE